MVNNSNILITESTFRNIIRNVLNKVLMRRQVPLADGIYEFEDRNEIKKYSSIVWDIMQKSYSKLGGFKSYKSKEDMENLVSLMVICVLNKQVVASAIYRDDLGGQKLNGCGTIDGRLESKKMLKQVIQNDIQHFQKWHWVEVSYPLEEWFKEFNGSPIPTQLVASLLHKNKRKILPLNDGVHYKRQIGKDSENLVTKVIYGFKDKSTYDKVMDKLEEYTGFSSYEEFKNHINSLPKLKEEIESLSNHPNKEVSIAMEIIIQFGNLYEDGIYDISPRMYDYLKLALQTLQNEQEKNRQIESLIRVGTQYLKTFNVLQIHTYDEAEYLLAPLK